MTSFLLRVALNTRACLLPRSRASYRAGYAHRYKFQSSVGSYEDKTAVLSDADTVWTDVRHMHMREAIDKLMADFNKFMTDNAGFKGCVCLASFVPNWVVAILE